MVVLQILEAVRENWFAEILYFQSYEKRVSAVHHSEHGNSKGLRPVGLWSTSLDVVTRAEGLFEWWRKNQIQADLQLQSTNV